MSAIQLILMLKQISDLFFFNVKKNYTLLTCFLIEMFLIIKSKYNKY